MLKDKICLKAYAKINLFLHVLGRNEKKYHLLDRIFVFADIGDDIIITQNDKDTVTVTADGEFKSDVPLDETNLVVKAANILGINKGINIHLSKNVPVSSGIGGGSADAAAVIRALISLYNLKISPAELNEKATKIGADVPSCVYAKACRIGGIGEIITPFNLKNKFKVLLINPLKKILTKDIFAIGIKEFSKPALIDENNLIENLKKTHNDLLPPALQLAPVISDIIAALNKTKGCLFANMSGSGATCFALYDNDDDMSEAEKTLRGQFKDYWIKTGNII